MRLASILAGVLAAVPGAAACEGDAPADVSALVEALGARLHTERATARQALIRVGPPAVPALLEALRAGDECRQIEAAQALGSIGGPEARAGLEGLLRREAERAQDGRWNDASLAYAAAYALGHCDRAGLERLDGIARGVVAEFLPVRHVAQRAAADIVEPALLALFTAADATGSYPGRFEELRRFGRAGVTKLLEIAASPLRPGENRFTQHADLAVQALGDGDDPAIVPGLLALADQARGSGIDRFRNQIAHSLFRLGHREMLEGIIENLERSLRPTGGIGRRSTTMNELALEYLHAGRYAESVQLFRDVARFSPQDAAIARYNEACALSCWGKTAEALAALRRSVVVSQGGMRDGYDNYDWMHKDGDLRALRALPGFHYVAACLIATDRLGTDRRKANPDDVKLALADLERARAGGYRIEYQGDRDGVLVALRGLPAFERCWKAMGGTHEGARPGEDGADPDADPGDDEGFDPPFGGDGGR